MEVDCRNYPFARWLPPGRSGAGHSTPHALFRRKYQEEGRMATGCANGYCAQVFFRLFLSYAMYLLISLSKSVPPQNRQLNMLTSKSKQRVDDFMEESTI